MHIQNFFFPSPTQNALIGVCAIHKHHIELNNTDKTGKNNNFFTEGSIWHPVRRFIPSLQHKLSGQSWLTSQGSNHWKFLADILQKVYSVQVLCSSLASPVERGTFPAGWVRYFPWTRSKWQSDVSAFLKRSTMGWAMRSKQRLVEYGERKLLKFWRRLGGDLVAAFCCKRGKIERWRETFYRGLLWQNKGKWF